MTFSPPIAPLFVPGDRPERFAKAAASGADAVIIDLEDAVAPEAKARARGNLRVGLIETPVILRVNAIGTAWHDEDIAAAIAAEAGGVMVPKAEDPAAIAALTMRLDGMPVLALIESAQGLAAARQIARIPGVTSLAFGSVDYCLDLGMAHRTELLLPARSELVLAARLGELLPPLDGVTTQLDDISVTQADARHARELGMGGKMCIHPRQVAPVQQAFLPSEAELAWARRVLGAGEGASALDGEMIDRPVHERAQRILRAQAR